MRKGLGKSLGDSHVVDDEVDRGLDFIGEWVSWHTMAHIVSSMGAFVEGVLHLHFQCILFPSPFISIKYLKCFQVESKVGLLPNHEKHCPSWLYPGHTMLPRDEDKVWDFYLSMKNISHTCSTLLAFLYCYFFTSPINFLWETFHCPRDLWASI